MKKHILKYIELNPDIGYHDLCKVFGVSLDNLFKLLNINNYKIKDKYIIIYNANGNEIYEEPPNGGWVKRKYDNNGNETYNEYLGGDWYKWEYEYDINGNIIKEEHSDGNKKK